MHFPRTLAIVAVLLFCIGTVRAQETLLEEVNGKMIACVSSGLHSTWTDCDTQPDFYSYVFVGSISSVAPAENGEQQVQIIPEEVFLGKPATPLNVVTSQAQCAPKLVIGERRLFFLRQEKNEPIVLDLYGGRSIPIAQAQSDIETFRRLETIGNFGILRGQVFSGEPEWSGSYYGNVIPYAHVSAISGDAQFTTTADAKGLYEFQPLPPGKYKLSVGPTGTVQPDDDAPEIKAGACSDVTLEHEQKGQIDGDVRRSDGLPVEHLNVLLQDAVDGGYRTAETDARGHFSFIEVKAGEYVVGMNPPGGTVLKNEAGSGNPPVVSMYYSGATRSSEAQVIKIAIDEKRDHIDFTVPIR